MLSQQFSLPQLLRLAALTSLVGVITLLSCPQQLNFALVAMWLPVAFDLALPRRLTITQFAGGVSLAFTMLTVPAGLHYLGLSLNWQWLLVAGYFIFAIRLPTALYLVGAGVVSLLACSAWTGALAESDYLSYLFLLLVAAVAAIIWLMLRQPPAFDTQQVDRVIVQSWQRVQQLAEQSGPTDVADYQASLAELATSLHELGQISRQWSQTTSQPVPAELINAKQKLSSMHQVLTNAGHTFLQAHKRALPFTELTDQSASEEAD